MPTHLRTQVKSGTGFAVSDDGLVLTNEHVIEGCHVVTAEGRGTGVVRAADRDNDLALVKFDFSSSPFTFRSTPAKVGEDVFAAGYPYGGRLGWNFTKGSVSALTSDSRVVQHTAPVQPGNSGGPLIDESGLVVGVVVARLSDIAALQQYGSVPQNVNFAIHANIATNFLRANDVEPVTSSSSDLSSPEAVAKRAKLSTVRLSCQTVAASNVGAYRVVGVAQNDVLKVRQRPSPDAPIVAVLAPETTGIEVIRYQEVPDQNPWALIRHGANEGWVNSRYLRR
jgi:serine protease Do